VSQKGTLFLFAPRSPKGDLLNISYLCNPLQGAGGKYKAFETASLFYSIVCKSGKYYRSISIQILHPKWPEFPIGPSINLNPAFSYRLIALLNSGSDSR